MGNQIENNGKIWKWLLIQAQMIPIVSFVFFVGYAGFWEIQGEDRVKGVFKEQTEELYRNVSQLKIDVKSEKKIREMADKKSEEKTDLILFEVRVISLIVKKGTSPEIVKEIEEASEIFRPGIDN